MSDITVDQTYLQTTAIDPRPGTSAARQSRSAAPAQSFEDALKAAQGGSSLHISKHAQSRLAERGLTLGSSELQRLEGAVDKAASKGSRDSLVLMDDLALVVSIRNRTVITAVDANSRRGNVFTNIDSVVLAE